MDAGIEAEPDTVDGELNLSPLPAEGPGSPNCPPPFTPNERHASSPSEHAEARKSAEPNLMLASWGEQPVNPLATQVRTVTGALWRKLDPKIATAPKTQSRSKDQNKDKHNSKQNQAVKLNIVMPESFTQ